MKDRDAIPNQRPMLATGRVRRRTGIAMCVAAGEQRVEGASPEVPLRRLNGHFFRSVLADRLAEVLSPPAAHSAGRYHRPGQTALYMSPTSDWAKIAVSGYLREDGRSRFVVPLLVGRVLAFDQHDIDACRLLGIDRELSNKPWRQALAAGEEPPSWRNADAVRAAGADGMIDRSRMIPGGWHLTLFRWNELGGPSVQICGDPVGIRLSDDGPKWGL